MSKKDLLKEKARGKLATSAVKEALPEEKTAVIVTGAVELLKITRDIRGDLDEMQDIYEWWNEKRERVAELKESIITRLIYVRDHKKDLLPERTFESYLVEDIGISKGYFYEQLQAYNLCIEYKMPGLFREIDHKVLVNIAREKDPAKQQELVGRAAELSRDDFKKKAHGATAAPKIQLNSAFVDRGALSIRVSDIKLLEALEVFMRQNGITVEHI